MADITRTGTPSLASRTPPQTAVINTMAGEALLAGDICYLGTAGTAFKSNGTAANAAAKVRGICFHDAALGEAVSLYHDVAVRYGAGMVIGTNIFASGAAGNISDIATIGGTGAIGFVESATVIRVTFSTY